ncbi:MAG TPA: glycosyl hydrolase family 28 protein [Pseudomonadales bacterium]|nr:glycosyl hydrolase family 28 protein [Pseudomonadales bacterium]
MPRLSFRYRSILAALMLMFGLQMGLAVTPWSILINTNYIVYVTNSAYGAVGDGVTTNTAAIQAAINSATKGGTTNGLVGGTVEIPAPGIYMCGPLTLAKNVNLQVDSGAILRMLPLTNYPGGTVNPANFISGSSLTNIEISGPGAIDGQGAPWWPYANTNGASRPVMISLSSCKYELIQNITLSNSPMFHIAIGGSAANSTVQGCTIRAPSSEDPLTPGHNTDADDVSGTNILIQNNNISVGDDNFTCGGGTSDILITNNTYGSGHGVSIGSYTSPYVSNMLVINCSFTGTDQGIRIKSDRDRGGFVHNIQYYNLAMTNVMHPILIYGSYTNTNALYKALDSISPTIAASYPAATYVAGKTPTYRDIIFSNITATGTSGRAAGLIWGLPECSVSNLTLIKVNISADNRTFGIYDANNVKIIDSSHTPSGGVVPFSFFNAQVTFSNSLPASNVVPLDGATTNGFANSFGFYNYLAALQHTNALDRGSSVFLSAATFTISNNLALSPSNNLNFALGTNTATLVVKGNLNLGGIVNVSDGGGLTNGTYTLVNYTGTLSGGLPALGAIPFGYGATFDTSSSGLVKLTVTNSSNPLPSSPGGLTATAGTSLVNLTWFAVTSATNYIIQRSVTSGGPYTAIGNTADTNYTDTQVINNDTYYYNVVAINTNGQGPASATVSATPQPPLMVNSGSVFTDTFSGSTLDSASPAAPTPTGTAYEILSSKSWSPSPVISTGHLKFGIGATTSGLIEAQALFTNSPIDLGMPGNSISLIITFTDTAGLLTQSGSLGFGLYNSGGGNFPVPGGLDGTLSGTGNATGNTQTWVGYVGQLSFTGMNSQIITRPAQTGTANNNQEGVTTGSGSSYSGPVTIGSASAAPSLTLAAGSTYTEMLSITAAGSTSLAITNSLYAGTSTNGTLLSQFGGIAASSTLLTTSFDAFAIGWRAQPASNGTASAIDINQIIINNAGPASTSGPSLDPTNIVAQVSGNQLQLSWPQDHLGWQLQIQTNSPGVGLGTNWVNVPNTTNATSASFTIDPANGSVFLRLVYP